MKNFISLILLIVFVSQEMSSQITSIKPPSNNPSQQIEYYDSLQNFLGEKCRQYIGQEFYVIPKDEALWKYGYSDFKVNSDEIGLSYSQKQKNNYKSTKDGYSTEYDALQGKYFYVEDVVPSGDSYIAYYIKLRNKENDEVVYFAYSSTVNSWVNFPFLVVGYFEKQKELFINQQVIIKDFPKSFFFLSNLNIFQL